MAAAGEILEDTSLFRTVLLILTLLVTLAPHAVWGAQMVDRIVAVVNGEIITLYEVQQATDAQLQQMENKPAGAGSDAFRQELQRRILDSKINDILLKQEAARLNITVSDTEVEGHIREFKQKNNITEDMFVASLFVKGMSREGYVKNIRETMLKQRLLGLLIRRKISVTDQDIQDFYTQHGDQFQANKKLGLRLIVLPEGKKADSLRKDILAGKISFEDAARKHSVGPAAESGGELGTVVLSEMAPQWKTALEGLKEGDVSVPLDLEGKAALLKIISVEVAGGRGLDEVRGQIQEVVTNQKMEARLDELIQRLREKAVLEIKL